MDTEAQAWESILKFWLISYIFWIFWAIASPFLTALLFKLLWNYITAPIFGYALVTYWQAFWGGITFLVIKALYRIILR